MKIKTKIRGGLSGTVFDPTGGGGTRSRCC